MSNQFNLNKVFTYKFWIICLCCLFIQSCQKEENTFNPCSIHFQYDPYTPASKSLDWIPYFENQELLFSNNKGVTIKLKRVINNEIAESLKSFFKIRCPHDSLQTSIIDYTTFEYRNQFIVTEGETTLLAIDIHVDVILDNQNSNLVDVKLADILILDFKIKKSGGNETTSTVLQFPILDRGYKEALAFGYIFYSSILLNNIFFTEVFSNYENNEQLRVYYSIQGLLGFEIQGDLFIKIN